MWECDYPSEHVDAKLVFLRFIKKIWVLLVAGIVGALLLGGFYYLQTVTFGPTPAYAAVSKYHVEYELMENGEEYTYINQTTWSELMDTDLFVKEILKNLENAGHLEITREEVLQDVDATLLSDTRFITATVTSESPEKSLAISDALEKTFLTFSDDQLEVKSVELILDPEEAGLVTHENRIGRVMILGAVLGLFFSIIGLYLYLVLDDSIYLPVTFERRYHIPMLWNEDHQEGKSIGNHYFQNKKHIAVVSVSGEESKNQEAQVKELLTDRLSLQQDNTEASQLSFCSYLEEDKLQQADAIVLAVTAGTHNGKEIEKTISGINKLNLEITVALLYEEDQKLIKRYYRHGGSR